MKTVRILIADDHELVRKGIATTLEEVPGWTVVAQADNGRQAVELAQSLRPDVVILDMTMPELNGLEATRQILSNRTGERVLILTAHESEQLVREVLNAGAQGYVLKSDAGRALVTAVEALLDGRPFFTSKVARRRQEQQGSGARPRYYRKDSRDPSRQHHAQDGVRLAVGSHPVRDTEQHRGGLTSPFCRTRTTGFPRRISGIPPIKGSRCYRYLRRHRRPLARTLFGTHT
jgi:DNA-binding NarL/FixJ family response regulator